MTAQVYNQKNTNSFSCHGSVAMVLQGHHSNCKRYLSNGIWSDFDSCTLCWWGAEAHGSCSVLASMEMQLLNIIAPQSLRGWGSWRREAKTKEQIRWNKHPKSNSFWAWNLWPLSTPMASVSEPLLTAPRSKTSNVLDALRSSRSQQHNDRLRSQTQTNATGVMRENYARFVSWRIVMKKTLVKSSPSKNIFATSLDGTCLIIPCSLGIKRSRVP